MALASEPLATARLALTPLRVADAAEMVGVLADPALYEYTGGAPPTRDELEARYTRQARGRSPDGRERWLNWIVRLASGAAIGFVQAAVANDTAVLAWVIAPDHQGRGYATEAAGAVAGWLTEQGVRTFAAYIRPDHAASAAVARSLGMVAGDTRRAGEVRWQRSVDDPDAGGA